LGIVVELRVRVITLDLMSFIAEDLLLNCTNFSGLILGLDLVLKLLLYDLDRSSLD
jgi:hypothetical protein